LIDCEHMKSSIRAFSLLVGITWSVVPGIDAQVNVVQEHNNLSRDGINVDPAFTLANAANLARDLTFDGRNKINSAIAFGADNAVKKVTVTVRATTGPFPGLRQTQQSVLVRFRDAG